MNNLSIRCNNEPPYNFCSKCGKSKAPDEYSLCKDCRDYKKAEKDKYHRYKRRTIDADTLLTMLKAEQEHSPSVGLQKAIAMVDALLRARKGKQ